jgi:hypothetical protein
LIATLPGFEPPVAELFALASTPFTANSFRTACERFSRFDPGSSDEDLWYFALAERPRLIVGLEVTPVRHTNDDRPIDRGTAVTFAVLSICWWESFLPSQHASAAAFGAERGEFDRVYDEARAAAVEAIGPPELTGTDTGRDGHQYAIWRGNTGLLILQQSAYDPQFGLDVNYWLHPWAGPDPKPTSPFIDWLLLERPRTDAPA